MSKTLVPSNAFFSRIPPNVLHIFGSELQVALPQEAQITAYQSKTNIRPLGLIAGVLMCERDSAVAANPSYAVVVRVAEDRELAEAVAKDVKSQLLASGFAVRFWLCAVAQQRYVYAYLQASEKHHE